jgi:hypothetical protein
MDWRRWRELISIHEELDTVNLLRKTVPSHQLYLVDRLVWLSALIDRVGGIEADRVMNLFAETDE